MESVEVLAVELRSRFVCLGGVVQEWVGKGSREGSWPGLGLVVVGKAGLLIYVLASCYRGRRTDS